jgi:hypothetical protein
MAHHCTTCGCTCYCRGDHSEIDTGYSIACMHCDDLPEYNEEFDCEDKEENTWGTNGFD